MAFYLSYNEEFWESTIFSKMGRHLIRALSWPIGGKIGSHFIAFQEIRPEIMRNALCGILKQKVLPKMCRMSKNLRKQFPKELNKIDVTALRKILSWTFHRLALLYVLRSVDCKSIPSVNDCFCRKILQYNCCLILLVNTRFASCLFWNVVTFGPPCRTLISIQANH